MAATTTQPYLWAVKMSKNPDIPGNVIITTYWRARDLTTGEMIELHSTNTQNSADGMAKDAWDSIYADAYDLWTAVTADTTHAASPFTTYPATL